MGWDLPGKVRKGLGLESGGLPLWRLPLPLNGRWTGPEALTGEWEGRQEKGAEEVEEETGSGKCGSKLFSWLRSRPDTLGVTINHEKLAGRDGQLLPIGVPMFEGVGSTTKGENISPHLTVQSDMQHTQSGASNPKCEIQVRVTGLNRSNVWI